MKTTWSGRAACRGLDPSIFFPSDDDAAATAKAVCSQCQVKEVCLEFALGERERDGVWGGCTERERRSIVRRRRRAS